MCRHFIILALVLIAATTSAQTTRPLELSYVLSFPKPQTHMFEVAMTIGNVTTPQLDVEMPTWTPGSYLQREFERNVQDFAADDAGKSLQWQKVNKATWRIATGASSSAPKSV